MTTNLQTAQVAYDTARKAVHTALDARYAAAEYYQLRYRLNPCPQEIISKGYELECTTTIALREVKAKLVTALIALEYAEGVCNKDGSSIVVAK